MASKESDAKIPFLLRSWLNLGRTVPTFKIGGLDFGFTLASFVVLSILRLTAVQVLIHVFGWPADNIEVAEKASSSLIPIIHSSNLVPALWFCFQSHKYSPSARFDAAPAWWQEVVHILLQFCTGYMVYDTLFSIFLPNNFDVGKFGGDDWVFLGHHIATSVYMTSTRILGAGHQSAMICMFLGEATNPFHNMYYFLEVAMKLSCCNGPVAQAAKYINTFLFAFTYVIIRALVAPPMVMFHACYDLLANGRKDIPLWVMLIWIFLIWGVNVGSIPWIQDCWNMLTKYIPGGDAASQEL